jgi:hypothetical protein
MSPSVPSILFAPVCIPPVSPDSDDVGGERQKQPENSMEPRNYRSLAALLVLFGLVCTADDTYVRLEDKGSDSDTDTNWHSTYGSEKEKSETHTFSLKIRNNNAGEKTYIVEWYFIAEDLKGKNTWIYDWGSKEVTLAHGKKTEFQVSSKEITGVDTKYRYSNYRERTTEGGEYDGYLVTVRVGDEFIKQLTSKRNSRQYLKKALKMAEDVNEDFPKD